MQPASNNKSKRKDTKINNYLNFLGILFLTIGITRFLVLLVTGNLRYFIWFSNHVMLLLGIGVLLRSRFLVSAELCIALIPETLWSLHFLTRVLFNKYLFGVSHYVFDEGINLITITALQHLLVVPFGLLAFWWLGASSKAWEGSLVHLALLWISGFLAGQEYNINCAFRCVWVSFRSLGTYTLVWFLMVFIMIVLSSLILQGLDFIKKRKDGPGVIFSSQGIHNRENLKIFVA